MIRPVSYRIMDAYDNGEFVGPQTMDAFVQKIGVQSGKSLGAVLFRLNFTKKYDESGEPIYHPPKKPRSRKMNWPERFLVGRKLADMGVPEKEIRSAIQKYGVDTVQQVISQDISEGLVALAHRQYLENANANAKSAEEVITTEELAEALRESSYLGKAALLNRARGLVKAATRKGEWQDFRNKGASTDGTT